MEGKAFRSRLSRRAILRYRVAVSPRMLQDWISEGLVAGPTPRGRRRGEPPDWQWGAPSYRAALQVSRLKELGCKRFDEFRVHLWLRRSKIPFEDMRKSLTAEFGKRSKQLFANLHTTRDPRTSGGAQIGKDAVDRAIGQPSPLLLPPAVQMLLGMKIASFDTMRFSVETNLRSELGTYAQAILSGLLSMEIPEWLIGILADAFAGVAGDPDEIEQSGLEMIDSATPAMFRNAREIVIITQRVLKLARFLPDICVPEARDQVIPLVSAFQNVAEILRLPLWRLATFVVTLNAINKSADEGVRMASKAAQIERIIRRIVQKRLNK